MFGSLILIALVCLLFLSILLFRSQSPVRRTSQALKETRVLHEGGTEPPQRRRRLRPAPAAAPVDGVGGDAVTADGGDGARSAGSAGRVSTGRPWGPGRGIDDDIEFVEAEPVQVVIDDTRRPGHIPGIIDGEVVPYRSQDEEDTGEFEPVRPDTPVATGRAVRVTDAMPVVGSDEDIDADAAAADAGRDSADTDADSDATDTADAAGTGRDAARRGGPVGTGTAVPLSRFPADDLPGADRDADPIADLEDGAGDGVGAAAGAGVDPETTGGAATLPAAYVRGADVVVDLEDLEDLDGPEYSDDLGHTDGTRELADSEDLAGSDAAGLDDADRDAAEVDDADRDAADHADADFAADHADARPVPDILDDSDELSEDDIAYVAAHRGRGFYDPVASQAVAQRRLRRRKQTLMFLVALCLIALASGVVMQGLAWLGLAVAVVVTVLYLFFLRRQAIEEQDLRRRRLARMRRARLGVRNTADDELGVPDRLLRPGAVVLEVDDADPAFDHLPDADVTVLLPRAAEDPYRPSGTVAHGDAGRRSAYGTGTRAVS
ncbi:gephyrin-like molybdotransferase receptor GlpR [Corynebacterium bovis]|uniref:divisome protein SepX/GlpR n=1 Tax=Corynebacterium bovis TaxID=36808 RepID=UPI00313A1E10